MSHEVGIDIGAEALASQTSQTSQPGRLSQTGLASQTSQTGLSGQTSQSSLMHVHVGLTPELEASQSSMDLEVGVKTPHILTPPIFTFSFPPQPRRGILRNSTDSPSHSPKSSSNHTLSHKSHTLPHTPSPGTKRPSPSLTRRTHAAAVSPQPTSPAWHKTYHPLKRTSPVSVRKPISAAGSVMGSGEFDRLEPRLDTVSDIGAPVSRSYGDGMSTMSVPHYGMMPWSPLDRGDWGMTRTPSLNSDLSSAVSSQFSRYPGYNMYPSHPHLSPALPPSQPHYSPNYPPTSDTMAAGHTHPVAPRLHNGNYDSHYTDSYNIRANEAGYPHGYDSSSLQRRDIHSNELISSSYPGRDVMSNVSFTAVTLSRDMQAPTR